MREYNRGKMIPFGAAGESDEDSVDTDGDGIPDSKDTDEKTLDDYGTEVDKDPRYWPEDPIINRDTGLLYQKSSDKNTWSDERSVPYKGYQGNDPRALMVDPQTGRRTAAKNQDIEGKFDWGKTGSWNNFSGSGDGGGLGFTDFSV